MAALSHTRRAGPGSRKLKRQQQCRRKSNLMKKASEYSEMCDADVCLGIRLRETGQVFVLLADATGFWAFIGSQLVCQQLFVKERQLTIAELTLPGPETNNELRYRRGLNSMHF